MADNKMVIQLLVRDEVTKQLNKLEKQSKKTSDSVKRNFTDMAVKVAAFTFAIKKAADVFNTFTAAASKVENLNVRLQQMLGSVEEGNKLFAEMRDLVSTAPVGFEEVMEAATQLSAVVKGGSEEVRQLIPIILDLSAATGTSIQDVTSNMIRAYSSGIAAADLFRDRGITAALGFKAGVSVSAEETMRIITEQWENGTNKMVGAIDNLRDTWQGRTEEMGDAWFNFRVEVGKFITDSEAVQNAIKLIAETLNELTAELERHNSQGEGLIETYFKMFTPVGALIDGISQLNITQEEQIQNMIEGNEQAAITLDALIIKSQEFVDQTEEATNALTDNQIKSAKRIEASLRSAFTGPLADMISGTKKADEALKSLGQGIIKVFADLVAQIIISKTIGQAIQKAAVAASLVDAAVLAAAWEPAAVFASIATAGGAAAAGTAGIVSTFAAAEAARSLTQITGSGATITALAEGGIVTRPTMALIGEAGPEAVVPLGRGGSSFGDVNIFIQGGVNPGGLSIDEMAEQLGFAFEREVRTARSA